MEATSDQELVERCLSGEDSAWRDIVMRYQRLIYNIAYRFTGRYDRAEDLAQEIFLKVYRSLGQFQKQRGEFKSWMTVMARNHLIDFTRKEKKGWTQSGGSEELEKLDYAHEGKSPHANLEQQDRIRFVHDCLGALSQDLRQALILREIEGMNYDEIAELLKIPLGTVKSRINRGRIELARVMNMQRLATAGAQGTAIARREHELPGI